MQTQPKSTSRIIRVLLSAFYTIAVVVQLMVIAKIIPYNWVNGGMSASYEAQAVQSVISVVVSALLFWFVWRVAGSARKATTLQRRLVYVITVFWVLGFVMQLIGTNFERYVISVTLVVGLTGHVLLLQELRKQRLG